MWILNDVIILAALAVLAFLYIRKKTAAMLAGVMICYCCLPAIRLGERGITPGYLVTAFLFVLFLIELFRKRIRLNRCQRLFLIAMAGSLLFTFLGWIINGSPAFSHLIHFAGLGQYMLGVLLLSIFFTSSDGIVTPEGVLYKAMPSILGLNGLFVIL